MNENKSRSQQLQATLRDLQERATERGDQEMLQRISELQRLAEVLERSRRELAPLRAELNALEAQDVSGEELERRIGAVRTQVRKVGEVLDDIATDTLLLQHRVKPKGPTDIL